MNYIYIINSIYKSYKYFFKINYEQEIDECLFNINTENEINNSDKTYYTNYTEYTNTDYIDNNCNEEIINNDYDKEYINNEYTNNEINIYFNNYLPLGIKLIFNEPINIIDNIHIGNIYNASNWSIVSNYNYLINFNKNIENFFPHEKNIKFYSLNLEQNLNNIDEILDLINQIQTKIDLKTKKEKKILLYSLAGNNTPCVIMIAYLTHKYNFEFKKALLYVCKKIPNYNINKKYFEILKLKYN